MSSKPQRQRCLQARPEALPAYSSTKYENQKITIEN
jgi:hypothetical protein